MANDEDLARVRQGTAVWNAWRAQNPERNVDLSEADLAGANLSEANLQGANLSGAKLSKAALSCANFSFAKLEEARLDGAELVGARLGNADLSYATLSWALLAFANLSRAKLVKANLSLATPMFADLSWANLNFADLSWANLTRANLNGANLTRANLNGANLSEANLSEANLLGANLRSAALVETNLMDADLTDCRVYGISAWDPKLEGARQRDLVITDVGQPEVTVDNLEVAQFIYLLLHNEKIRDVIDTIGKKGVLLLGRFSGGRMVLLDRLREELRGRDFIPIVFNFERPEKSDFTETVRTLVGLCRFIIADITSPRSTPLELQATVPDYMIPFVPIIEDGEEPFAMFQDLWVKHRAWVLDPIAYGSVEELVQGLDEEIIKPALARFDELVVKKAEKLRVRRIGARSTAAPFP